ncbi:chloride channel protein [Ileibacterium valens]|uniref:chloride channel protein n=1 Tax=Ileibacterium valens TaxID=1862668 RepID=UPI00272D2FD8|nr:chloride channel protein [Ileibacterium valens]
MNEAAKRIKQNLIDFSELGIWIAMGLLIGAITAFFEFIYQMGLETVLKIHSELNPWILFGMPFAGLLLVVLFEKYGKKSRKGMNLVFEISQGKERWIPKRTLSLMMFATWISNLFGASVGREGVAMQIGTTIASFINRRFPFFYHEKTIFLVSGMAAGFAGLFGTPYTAVFFAIEVLVAGTLKYRALPCTIAASLMASWVGGLLGLNAETHILPAPLTISSIDQGWKYLLLGIGFGIVGGSFAWISKKFRGWILKKIPDGKKRVLIVGIILAVLLFVLWNGRYSNFGTNLIDGCFYKPPMTIYPWDWLVKMLLTIGCLSVGFVGGEVTPLFAIGSSLGFVIGPLFGMDPAWSAALGYAAVFGAGTNTWLAPIMVGIEIFGFGGFPAFFIACSAAYLVNHSQSIYALQQRYEEEKTEA